MADALLDFQGPDDLTAWLFMILYSLYGIVHATFIATCGAVVLVRRGSPLSHQLPDARQWLVLEPNRIEKQYWKYLWRYRELFAILVAEGFCAAVGVFPAADRAGISGDHQLCGLPDLVCDPG